MSLKDKLFNRFNSKKDGIYNIHQELEKKISSLTTNKPSIVKEEMWSLISKEWADKLSTIIAEELDNEIKEIVEKYIKNHINEYHE